MRHFNQINQDPVWGDKTHPLARYSTLHVTEPLSEVMYVVVEKDKEGVEIKGAILEVSGVTGRTKNGNGFDGYKPYGMYMFYSAFHTHEGAELYRQLLLD